MISQFISEHIVANAQGSFVTLDDFVREFHHFLVAQGVAVTLWPKKRIRAALVAEGFLVGSYSGRGIIVADCFAKFSAKKKFAANEDTTLRLVKVES